MNIYRYISMEELGRGGWSAVSLTSATRRDSGYSQL